MRGIQLIIGVVALLLTSVNGEEVVVRPPPLRRSPVGMIHFRKGSDVLRSRASSIFSPSPPPRRLFLSSPRHFITSLVKRKPEFYKNVVKGESLRLFTLGSALMIAPHHTLQLLMSTDFVATPTMMFITQTLGGVLTAIGMTLLMYHKGIWAAPVVPFGVSLYAILQVLFTIRHARQLSWWTIGGVAWIALVGGLLASMS